MGPIQLNTNIQPILPLEPGILRHPMIPQGAFGLNPRTALGKEWWDATRRAAEELNNHCCYACGIHKSDTQEGWLDGHEMYEFDYAKRRMAYLRTVSICTQCHGFIHIGYLIVRLQKSEIDQVEFVQTILHGYKVLRNADLWPTHDQVYAMNTSMNNLSDMPFQMLKDLIGRLPPELVAEALAPNEHAKSLASWRLVIDGKEFKSGIFEGVTEVKGDDEEKH
jgi:hypothetical protein